MKCTQTMQKYYKSWIKDWNSRPKILGLNWVVENLVERRTLVEIENLENLANINQENIRIL